MYEKEKEATEAHGEVMRLKRALKEADDQCLLLFGEVQKAWKLASSLQEDLNNYETYINELQVLSLMVVLAFLFPRLFMCLNIGIPAF